MKSSILLILSLFASSGIAMADHPKTTSEPTRPPSVQFNSPTEPLSLWYRSPANAWTDALPIGNGRLGAMVFGGANREHLQLNEGTLWAAGPYDPVNPEAKDALPRARQLIFDGKFGEASELLSEKVMAKPLNQMPYQTLGDLYLDFPEVGRIEAYRRDLNLNTAVVSTQFTVDGVEFTRKVFSSAPDQLIVVRLTSDRPGQISFTARLSTPQSAGVSVDSGDTLVMSGVNSDARGIKGALKFQARVRIVAEGGTTTSTANSVQVAHAHTVTLFIAAATSYKSYKDVSGDPETLVKRQIQHASNKSYTDLLRRHAADYQQLFHRTELDLGHNNTASALTTAERLDRFALDENAQTADPQLAVLYFQYGRYLLISSSRPGGQPATLQGLWNDSMSPPWDSKYTININTEMNYWPAESGNLAECVEPLQSMIEDLSQTGARTAQEMYGARGWVVHHNADLWRASAPIDSPFSGMWPMGGAWLLQSLWEHYLFSPDKKYLEKIYPLLKGSAQFFLDTLVEDPNTHFLVTNPSVSPENSHPPTGESVCAGPTMDMEILRDLFDECVAASQKLDLDPDFRAAVVAARTRLAPLKIGKAGQLQEWQQDWDMEAPEIHHRHVSHLYGLYPSAQIDLNSTPELAAAARRSLEIRGDEATGWGMGWRLNLWARLHEGDHAYKILTLLLHPVASERVKPINGGGVYPNLFDAHPPFQIDGNFGGAAGIMEMLVQSHNGEIQFLPALPSAWPTGHVKGVRARGGFTLDFSWSNGKLSSATIHSVSGNVAHLNYRGTKKEVVIKPGESYHWNVS